MQMAVANRILVLLQHQPWRAYRLVCQMDA